MRGGKNTMYREKENKSLSLIHKKFYGHPNFIIKCVYITKGNREVLYKRKRQT